ncbi:MAG TPA: 3-oxoacyl-[acyl-carrier-protein] synthase III C-terminal domain-containing protein [Candidatus Xenobia bacterium]|jgi:alkylresorcinol/alkylpyrone synthase
MVRIAGVGTAVPPYRYEQATLTAAAERVWADRHFNAERIGDLFRAVRVGGRNLSLPLDRYLRLSGFGEANRVFHEVGADIGESALRRALDHAGLQAQDVDAFYFATVTGLSTPSLDARLCNRLGLRSDVKRVPIFGLGCAAGAAGVARLYDYLRGWPAQVAVLLCVELCSLTLQQGDLSVANLIATGLFGDGAAAVIATGDGRAAGGPEIVGTRSTLYPNTEHVMGWDIGEWGFKVVLSAAIPEVVRTHVAPDVDRFLADHRLQRSDVQAWICHPGGPKIIAAFQEALGLRDEDLSVTRRSLEDVGNLSSASVLFVLEETLRQARLAAGAYGLLMAMGPGFQSEMVLLRW